MKKHTKIKKPLKKDKKSSISFDPHERRVLLSAFNTYEEERNLFIKKIVSSKKR